MRVGRTASVASSKAGKRCPVVILEAFMREAEHGWANLLTYFSGSYTTLLARAVPARMQRHRKATEADSRMTLKHRWRSRVGQQPRI